MKKIISSLLIFLLSFSLISCSKNQLERFTRSYYDYFDTCITFICYTDTESSFEQACDILRSSFRQYHRLFDAYHPYENIENIYTLNEKAAKQAVHVEDALFELIHDSLAMSKQYCDKVNIAMGSVLSLWHDARDDGTILPDPQLLTAASSHTSPECVLLDEEEKTVFFTDAFLRLDVGATAKGFAVQKTVDKLKAAGYASFLISAGGNIYACGEPQDGRTAWNISIQDPADAAYSAGIIKTKNNAVVTSGDYQRSYTLDGVNYHHIISPDTLFPAKGIRSVTVVASNSFLADYLSTALFIIGPEEGSKLLKHFPGAQAYWILEDGTTRQSDGMKQLMK